MVVDYRTWLARKGATIDEWLEVECSGATSPEELVRMTKEAFKRARLTYPPEGSRARSELVSAYTRYGHKWLPVVEPEAGMPTPHKKPKKKRKPRKKKPATEVPPSPQPEPVINISDSSSSSLELAE